MRVRSQSDGLQNDLCKRTSLMEEKEMNIMNDGWVFSNLQKNSRDQKLKPVVTDCSPVSTLSNLAMSNLSCCKEGLLIFETKFCLTLAFTTVVLVTTEGIHTGSDCVSSNICSTSLLLLLLFCCSFCGANNNKPFRFFSW